MPALSGRAIGAAVVAALAVAVAGWGAGRAASSGATTGAAQSPPVRFSPPGDRVEIGSIARRRELPELGSIPAPARKPAAATKTTPPARARSRALSPRPIVPPPPARPPVLVPPPPAQGTPGGDFSTGGTT